MSIRYLRGLIVKRPYVDLILSGAKVWELRRTYTRIRGTIALICDRAVVGLVDLIDVFKMGVDDLIEHVDKHCVPPDELYRYAGGRGELYVWVLARPRRLSKPIYFDFPRGAQVWVRLPREVVDRVVREICGE
ncbi:MAG: RNA-binding protein [Thermoprotei archaeon]|nr:MAG: RNA-binding protein [Thermoprotei archaeon]